MSSSLTIDVYADIACPWCYVGGARLRRALEKRPALDVERRWRPFQLQPNMPPEGRDFRTVLEQKFGDGKRVERMFDRVREMGREEGLSFNFDAIDVAPNTVDAHRLVLWAEDRQGPGAAASVATTLFRAYFSEGRNVSSREVLVDCAAESGFESEDGRDLLEGTEYGEEVQKSQQRAQRRGITGVPYYVFDDRHALTGAQPVAVMVEALEAAAEERSTRE